MSPISRLQNLKSGSLSKLRFVGVAICSTHPEQQHLGLFHSVEGNKNVRLLHLAWHHELTDESPRDGFLWIDPDVPARRLRQVAAICRQVWRENGKFIGYAFSPPNDCLDERTGRYLIGESRHGLTCASFVLAIFNRAGLNLIDFESWPSRSDDQDWQRRIIELLKRPASNATSSHIDSVKAEIGCVRFRPTEVAGAAATKPHPVSFTDGEKAGKLILKAITFPGCQ